MPPKSIPGAAKINLAVLISTYQGDDPVLLDIALLSIFNQNLPSDYNMRIYMGIDGPISSDLETIISRHANKIYTIVRSNHNEGLARTLNKLILALEDELYVFRMDADDISMPNRFSSQIAFLDTNTKIDVVGGNAEIINAEGFVCGEIKKSPNDITLKRRLPFDSPFIHPTVAMRGSLLRNGHRYPTDTIRFEDVAFWSELALSGAIFANLTIPILRYRSTEASTRRRTGWRKVLNETSIRSRYVLRVSPWRLDVLFLVILIALAKWLMPVGVLMRLHSVRARILSLISS